MREHRLMEVRGQDWRRTEEQNTDGHASDAPVTQRDAETIYDLYLFLSVPLCLLYDQVH